VLASKLRGLLADRGIGEAKVLSSAFGFYSLNLPDGPGSTSSSRLMLSGLATAPAFARRSTALRERTSCSSKGAMSRRTGLRVAYAAWEAVRPAIPDFIQTLFSCRSSLNYSRSRDPALERRIGRAVNLQQIDPLGGNRLWAKLDREITDNALWVPLYNGYGADLVSKRVRNYQYNPQLGALLSQLWAVDRLPATERAERKRFPAAEVHRRAQVESPPKIRSQPWKFLSAAASSSSRGRQGTISW
jgi:hypothetical protein